MTTSSVQVPDGALAYADVLTFQVTLNNTAKNIQAVTFVDSVTGLPISSTSRLPVLNSLPYESTPPVNMSVQTDAAGTGFVAFADQACDSLDLFVCDLATNSVGVGIEYRRLGTGVAIPIPYRSSQLIIGLTNANEISIRRYDQSTTQVTVFAEAHTK